MDVTVGICAYNEEGNIKKLLIALLAQTSNSIKQIIVVSSGSTDNTNELVRQYSNPKIKLLTQKKRQGKVSAINIIIKHARTPIISLISADVIPKKNTIEELCKPFKEPRIGITGSRPIPLNSSKSLVGFAVNVVWGLHHDIAMKIPKFGECIAFRKVFQKLPNSAVDEEEIASLLFRKGYSGAYCPKAIVNNKGPTTIRGFVRQRRRIYAGHLSLKRKSGYSPPTMSNLKLLILLLSQADLKAPIRTMFAVALEAASRMLGYYDYILGKNHHIWKQSPSTKNLKEF